VAVIAYRRYELILGILQVFQLFVLRSAAFRGATATAAVSKSALHFKLLALRICRASCAEARDLLAVRGWKRRSSSQTCRSEESSPATTGTVIETFGYWWLARHTNVLLKDLYSIVSVAGLELSVKVRRAQVALRLYTRESVLSAILSGFKLL
jgi:hypothetical protein